MKKGIIKIVLLCILVVGAITIKKDDIFANTVQIGNKTVEVIEEMLQDPEFYKYYGTDEQKRLYVAANVEEYDENAENLYRGARTDNGILGCDVSQYQGDIDWNKAKNAGINFVFIRVAKRGLSNGVIYEDTNYKKNIEGALKAGIKVGCYIFSEAITNEEAIEEADYIMQRVSGYNISLPVVIDYEGFTNGHRIYNANLTRQQMTDIVSTFCERVKSRGYTPAVYGSASYFKTYMDGVTLSSKYNIWAAAYSKRPEEYTSTTYDFWQFSETGDAKAYGMQSKNLDMDYCYSWNGLADSGNGNFKYYNNGIVNRNYTGFTIYNGDWYLMKNGSVDTSYTGLYYYNKEWWYLKNGKLDFSITTLCEYNGKWWYVKNSKVDFSATTVYKYYTTWWYVKNGQVDFKANTLCKYNGSWWYIRDGHVDYSTTTVHKYNGTWWYVHDGYVDFKARTLCKYNGTWWYIDKGRIDWNTVTVVKFGSTWYYVHNGYLNWNDNGLCYYYGRWWYIRNGVIDFNAVTLCKYNGIWWYVHDGFVDFSERTLCKYGSTWWFINHGQVSWEERTLVKYGNTWYFVNNGQLDWDYTGTCQYDGYVYYVRNGVVDFSVARYKNSDWVSGLNISKSAKQLILVQADGTYADVSMHYKDADGNWSQIVSTTGRVGKNGIGKTKEGDRKTPIGVYSFIKAFGNASDPGCAISYTHCDSSYYWVDDSDSRYYNQFVSSKNVKKDWKSAEYISRVGASYNYVLALNYNKENKKGAGSAIFLHCGTKSTAGCVAVPENVMKLIMKSVHKDCYIIIDYKSNIGKY